MAKKAPWWDRLNAMLMPRIGPPPLGPYNEAPLPPTGPKPCPVCGMPMSEHRIERGASGDGRTATRIHCPDRATYAVPHAIDDATSVVTSDPEGALPPRESAAP